MFEGLAQALHEGRPLGAIDHPVIEITGATTGLVVSAGRLIGPVPGLTAVAVAAR